MFLYKNIISSSLSLCWKGIKNKKRKVYVYSTTNGIPPFGMCVYTCVYVFQRNPTKMIERVGGLFLGFLPFLSFQKREYKNLIENKPKKYLFIKLLYIYTICTIK